MNPWNDPDAELSLKERMAVGSALRPSGRNVDAAVTRVVPGGVDRAAPPRAPVRTRSNLSSSKTPTDSRVSATKSAQPQQGSGMHRFKPTIRTTGRGRGAGSAFSQSGFGGINTLTVLDDEPPHGYGRGGMPTTTDEIVDLAPEASPDRHSEEETDSDGEEDVGPDDAVVDEIMESSGLPREAVLELLTEYKTEQQKAKRASKRSSVVQQPRQDVPPPVDGPIFVTATPELIVDEQPVQETLQPRPSPRSAIQDELAEFLPQGGVSNSHNERVDTENAMEAFQKRRQERQQQRHANVAGYLDRKRGSVEKPAVLVERSSWVDKYEQEIKMQKDKKAAKEKETRERRLEERKEKFVKGFFSNAAIQKRIEANHATEMEKHKLRMLGLGKQPPKTGTAKSADSGKGDTAPVGKEDRTAASYLEGKSPPKPGDAAVYVTDDGGKLTQREAHASLSHGPGATEISELMRGM